jgi:hypothetical protein
MLVLCGISLNESLAQYICSYRSDKKNRESQQIQTAVIAFMQDLFAAEI